MKIVVCIKTPSGGAVDAQDAFTRAARTLASVLPPFDCHAVEEALRLREKGIAKEIVVVSVGSTEGLGGVKEALALGADRAVMLAAPELEGSDLLATSRALAALLRHEGADLYLSCPWSGDSDGTLLWAMTAERLGLPMIGQLRSLAIEDGKAKGERQAESGDYSLVAPLPCLVEVSENINKARYVTMKGRQAARAKPVKLVSLADIGLTPESIGSAGSGSRVLAINNAPATRETVLIDGDAQAPAKVLAFLEAKGLLA